MMNKVEQIFEYLNELFPNPKCELNYEDNFQLLVAVILSAQCTDKRVNVVTPLLFEKYPTAKHLASAKQEDVEAIIRPLGFFRTKSKAIIACAKQLCEEYAGEVPNDVEKLQKLAGVGRKTANVVTAEAFNANNIGVDTHIFRVAHRLTLSSGTTPNKVEDDLRRVFAGRNLAYDHFLLVLFGRYNCKALKPLCDECKLKDICDYYKNR